MGIYVVEHAQTIITIRVVSIVYRSGSDQSKAACHIYEAVYTFSVTH